ncbi:MAG: methylenetetrahydrofolate reductase [Lachnospiraceae bacterium]|jgi:methylenetetrahydrofolate reductase (NADPH)|uniref:methylenetetrahydrofolate reductase n=1 Tax=Clostridium sp. (strain SY8519) TaxID=1042156 RepID=UPI0002171D22|nr:methylenetetrahydrofolate reductase [Clostridium sp. SY8519]MCI1655894.1 methylenetetrahydrofolate reductase [Lachnospiraceae bacterium]MCI1658071.1 methylenetetrahydrofolate reductase [Lachnospiraceae bacterium]MCI2196416.1 methylenetetrahydrofolate reductase [Lachnospiraceae bacterium]BAK48225.1 hypothetical protein CXIVA_22580 [Clostridium sp. SY8519]
MPDKYTCEVEMNPPKQNSQKLEEDLATFAERFERVMESGFVASITDNAMGILHFQPHEMIEELDLKPRENQVLIHLNTFHTKEVLDEILAFGKSHNITNFLCLSGDGSDKMHKLEPEELEAPEVPVTTSVELIRYIRKYYPEFHLGAAFNPYEPEEKEFAKLKRKVEAGAEYIITQPILGRNPLVDRVMREYPDLPVVIECWMSKKVYLLSEVIGETIPEDTVYDGYEKLLELQKEYPDSGNYLAMMGFKKTYPRVEELWKTRGAS